MNEPIDELLKVTQLVVTAVALGTMVKGVLLLNGVVDSPNPTPQETEEVRCDKT